MDRHRKLKSTDGHIRELLKENGDFKSVKAFSKYLFTTDNVQYTDAQIKNMMLENHNQAIEEIQQRTKEERQNVRIKRKTEDNKNISSRNLEYFRKKQDAQEKNKYGIVVDELNKKPSITTKQFKNTSFQYLLTNPENVESGYASLSILKYTVPILRNKVHEFNNISVIFTFKIQLYKYITEDENEETIYFLTLERKILLSNDDIPQLIQQVKGELKSKIEGLEIVGSGWRLDKILSLELKIHKYNTIRGSSYIPLDKYLSNKKCCINIKNTDEKCLLYCILYHIHQDEIKDHPERVNHYKKYQDEFSFKGIEFPVKISSIPKIETIINYGIHIWGYDGDRNNKPFLLYKSQRKDDKIINLLYIKEILNGITHGHYVYIKNFNVFVKENQKQDGIHVHKPSYYCVNCMKSFVSKENLDKHKSVGCDSFEPQSIKLPEINERGVIPTIQFKNYNNKFKAPVVIYADFETLVKPFDDGKEDNKCKKIAELPPCGYCFNVVSQYKELNFGLKLYRGENTVEHLLKALLKIGEKVNYALEKEMKMIITPEQEKEFQMCKVCHICEKPIKIGQTKVRDHDHINGLYRGCAHQDCNINLNNKNYKIPIFFHNLKSFDGHLIIQGLKTMNFENIGIIAQNFEKYMKIQVSNLLFLDSFAFLSSSLDTLSSNLNPYVYKKEDKDTLEKQKEMKLLQLKNEYENVDVLRNCYKHTSSKFNDDNEFLNVIKKGVYPYQYIDSFEKFYETKLPSIEMFYSSLSDSVIDDEEYEHALKVWDTFNIKNLGEYHDLYLKTDVLLLTDVFETFRDTAYNSYNLDPSKGYLTLPSFSWDAMLYKTNIKLENLTDIDMYIFCERGIRGGISMISHRHAKANNKYMKNYDPKVESSYIQYLDANNLYGGAMCEKLPYADFQWVNDFDIEYVKNYNSNGDKGVYVECDLDYPDELHDLHNNYPLAPESKCILTEDLSPYQLNQLKIHNEIHNDKIKKLIPNLNHKKNYVCHIKNLQYYISKGLILTKVHRVLEFSQKEWLKEYIDFNTNLRKNAKNDFEKDFYKLMNNAVFGKTMENMRSRVDIKLYSDEQKALYQIAKPQLIDYKIYSKDLLAIKQIPKQVILNKPIYAGMAILDLSKLIMYDFHYDYIKPKYGDNATLLFTDTDSLCYHIKTEDLYKDNYENKDKFDLSEYDYNDEYRKCDNTNKKVVRKMKDETKGIPIIEFAGLRSKMYSCLLDNQKEKKTAKGIKNTLLKNNAIRHKDYVDCLMSEDKNKQRQVVSFNNLRAFDHNIFVYKYVKTGLSSFDDKGYLKKDGITKLAFGHYKIPK